MSAPCYVATFTVDTTPPGTHTRLDGSEGHHAATVRRTRTGERIDLVNGSGGRLVCEVTAVSKASLDLTVLAATEEPMPNPRITLVQALAKGGRDEQAVETATEFGVAAIIPWHAERSIANWRGKEEKARARWQSTAVAAAKQSRRAWIPEVSEPLTTAALADLLATRSAAGEPTFVCHEEATAPLARLVDVAGDQDIFVVVGPEGGISPHEIELFEKAGATTCLLGTHVLRSATAGPYAIATLMALGTTLRAND
ncbi:MAG: 16S rRNA (uracil(1498)-N(3))-methyltransferase [Ancrocorticia sp.]|uniref:16S rRNA (uracil(1498)-N(3))-methyltransferase n=1 Tax=Ancrocorticia sp. TaxID=2593684 RepID=UPI003F8F8930